MIRCNVKMFFMKTKIQYSKGEVYHDNQVLNLKIIHILHSISLSVSLPHLKRRTKALKVCVSSIDCTYDVVLAEWLLYIYRGIGSHYVLSLSKMCDVCQFELFISCILILLLQLVCLKLV